MTDTSSSDRAIELFRDHGGILRTKEALELGIHRRTLYRLRDEGMLERISWGVYRLASLPDLGNPDLIAVVLRIPRAVVCLVSALAYHEMTSEIPHEVHIALPRGTKEPRLDHPPIRVFRLTGPALSEGIERVKIDGVVMRIYSPEKTVADCFRFRNKMGIDVAVEALKYAIQQKRISPANLLRYARICRVEKVMMPYLEALG
jgi:predicted transcriptional regulator of viral defense system